MKKITWNVEKEEVLSLDQSRGGITFEDCAEAIENGKVLDDIPNPSSKHQRQRLLILEINHYAYVVPYIESKDSIFLKTVYPSRKYTRVYFQR
tara:strand:+ start:40 stop:318 length:279 start_codon:yes stop_codon:yes gene_type:complete